MIISLAVGYATITNGGFRGRSRAFAAPVTGLSMPGAGSSIPPASDSVLRHEPINKTLRADQPVGARHQEESAQFAALSVSPTAPPANVQEDAVVRAASVAPEANLPPYQPYQVQDGDTVGSIAARFGLDAEYITANNVEIQDSDFLTLGQWIIVPAGNGILHEVRLGDTLSDIAARYDVDTEVITGFAANGIESADDITEAQLVYVAGGRPLPAEAPAPEPAPEAGSDDSENDGVLDAPPASSDDDSSSGGDDGGGGIVAGGPSSGSGLIWPLPGPISSYYSSGHPLGIDIDGFNLGGAAIGAATSGTVVFAGGNACCSYGLYVVIVSPEGIETLYAHLSSVSVSQGASVSQGEQIGIIGDTGYSTGTHLHFEVIDNGVRVNPLGYLP